MIADGRVRVNGLRASRATKLIGPTDAVIVTATSRKPANTPSPAALLRPLVLIYEDDDLLVIDKPAGLLTSTVASEKRPTALAKVRAYAAASEPEARVGLIHRLDRDASGLLVFSKSHRAYDSLKTQFFKHTVERVYEATVYGRPNPPKGSIESRLIERADGTVRPTTVHAKGQRAITEYELIEKKGKQSILRVKLLTGRKHQIRVHLSQRGWPIVGDSVYGPPARPGPSTPPGPLMLRAATLAFDHPRTGQRVSFTA